MTRLVLAMVLAAGLAAAGGCNDPIKPPPRTMAEYSAQGGGRLSYPTQVIIAHNLQRALDRDVPPQERIKSLELAAHVGGSDPAILAQLAGVLTEPETPQPLREAALETLLRLDYPNLAGYLVKVLPLLGNNPKLRESALDWLGRHPQVEALGDVITIWAAEPSTNSADEPRYRQVIQRMAGQDWEAVLLNELNNPAFAAYASAYDVLIKRVPESRLRPNILGTVTRAEPLRTLHAMLGYLDYLPGNGTELSTAMLLIKTQAAAIEDTSRLATGWRTAHGYHFNIRDFHLISRLARDPLRPPMDRSKLVSSLTQSLVRREHLPYRRNGQPTAAEFDKQADQLTVADLWNLYLLVELLNKPHVQTGMRVMAERDRADRTRAWGGLIFYRNGHAEPQLYEASKALGENDLRYLPTLDVLRLGRDALCLFHAHFEKVQNLDRTGPSSEELADARANNMYGLVVAGVNETVFAAHYYNPRGQVISLGVISFGQPPGAAPQATGGR